MRKQQRPNRKGRSATDRSQASASLYASMAGHSIPDHELNVMGSANVMRRFDIDEYGNAPYVVYRITDAMKCFTDGYSAGSRSDGDTGAAQDVSVIDPDTALNPITKFAHHFESNVYPVFNALMCMGTGTRPPVGINALVRYITHTIRAYRRLLTPLVINHLTYHFDWTKVAPFTNSTPKHLFDLCDNLGATDIGIANTYLPLMKQLESYIMFPRILNEVKRMYMPMMSVDLNGRLQVPVGSNPATTTESTVVDDVKEALNYLNAYLSQEHAAIATFLPFPMRELNPWLLPTMAPIDVDRDSGWFNSCCQNIKVFGDTGDPGISDCMVCDAAEDNGTVYFTRHAQPIWAEIRMSTIFKVTDDATDDEFELVTPHRYRDIVMVDDNGDYFSFDGSPLTNASDGWRYMEFANCRFALDSINYGIQKPGTCGAKIYLETIERLMRLECEYLFNVDAIKNVLAVTAGSGVREVRRSVKETVQYGVSSAF